MSTMPSVIIPKTDGLGAALSWDDESDSGEPSLARPSAYRNKSSRIVHIVMKVQRWILGTRFRGS